MVSPGCLALLFYIAISSAARALNLDRTRRFESEDEENQYDSESADTGKPLCPSLRGRY